MAVRQRRLIDAPYKPRPRHVMQFVGSKRRLLPNLRAVIRGRSFTTYCEPFAGSAALAFDLIAGGFDGRVVLNDVDAELMAMYRAIRDDVKAVDEHLANWQAMDWQVQHRIVKAAPDGNEAYRAARRIALTNGSYRSTGHTPKTSRFPYCRDSLYGAARALQSIELRCGAYADIEPQQDWMVYVDPPYVCNADVDAGYDYELIADVTGLAWHKRLRAWLDGLDCDWIASNSSAAESLYDGLIIDRPRLHASMGNRRTVTELIAASWARAPSSIGREQPRLL